MSDIKDLAIAGAALGGLAVLAYVITTNKTAAAAAGAAAGAVEGAGQTLYTWGQDIGGAFADLALTSGNITQAATAKIQNDIALITEMSQLHGADMNGLEIEKDRLLLKNLAISEATGQIPQAAYNQAVQDILSRRRPGVTAPPWELILVNFQALWNWGTNSIGFWQGFFG
jgi:hypothetical protein